MTPLAHGSWRPSAAHWSSSASRVLLLWRFRRLNHVRIDGLLTKAVMGSSVRSSLAEAGGLVAAIWAAQVGQWWLAVTRVGRRRRGVRRQCAALVARLPAQPGREPARHLSRGPRAGLRLAALVGAVPPARAELMRDLDPLIHPPVRLQLMTMLTAVSDAEFVTLRDASTSATRCCPSTSRRWPSRLRHEPQGCGRRPAHHVDLPHQVARALRSTPRLSGRSSRPSRRAGCDRLRGHEFGCGGDVVRVVGRLMAASSDVAVRLLHRQGR